MTELNVSHMRLSLAQPYISFPGEAEVDRQAKPADVIENDPKRTPQLGRAMFSGGCARCLGRP
jgi:hypothetical protein